MMRSLDNLRFTHNNKRIAIINKQIKIECNKTSNIRIQRSCISNNNIKYHNLNTSTAYLIELMC
jgi:hypothetical protein